MRRDRAKVSLTLDDFQYVWYFATFISLHIHPLCAFSICILYQRTLLVTRSEPGLKLLVLGILIWLKWEYVV